MEVQEILVLIQTGIGILSLIVALITLNKVNKIKIKIIDKSKKQVSVGKDNKQKMK